jgi:ubiquinone/menaquinone biosynthesis C-methylase UbiE
MGLYARRVLPRLTNRILDNDEFAEIRRRVVTDLDGTVLEIGFGSGLNVPHYPTAVQRVLAVEPSTVARQLAAGRVAASHVAVEYVGLDGQRISLDDASVDHALTTWTLCTIPDVTRALAEIHRVLRPDGALHFVEHGRSPAPAVARWQDRLTPIQRRVAGGCHLNRPIDQLLTGSGLRLARMDNYYASGPKALGYMYEGVARKF